MDREEMERIAAPHDSKAAKIRALNKAGVTTTDISTFLGIRYQHAYNVLLRARRIIKPDAGQDITPLLPLEVGDDGAVMLTAAIMRDFGITAGGRVFARRTEQGLLIIPQDEAIAELRRLAAERMPEHANLLDVLLNGTKPRPNPSP